MEKIETLRGVAAPMMLTNVNTDAIFPALYMTDASVDLGAKLFANWRYDPSGAENPDFILNRPGYRDSKILVAGENFGCGSSREQAVWALMKFGIRVVIAPSFGEIFHDNAFQNGLLCIRADTKPIAEALARLNDPSVTVDLRRLVIDVPTLGEIPFPLAPDRRAALLEGLDEIAFILASESDIAAFERRDEAERGWVYERHLG